MEANYDTLKRSGKSCDLNLMLTGLSDLFTVTALVSWEQPAITLLTFGFYFGDFYEIEAFTFFFRSMFMRSEGSFVYSFENIY